MREEGKESAVRLNMLVKENARERRVGGRLSTERRKLAPKERWVIEEGREVILRLKELPKER